jgi:hypothetical protein
MAPRHRTFAPDQPLTKGSVAHDVAEGGQALAEDLLTMGHEEQRVDLAGLV